MEAQSTFFEPAFENIVYTKVDNYKVLLTQIGKIELQTLK